MAESKYGHLVKTMPINKGEPTGANARELIWIYAKDPPCPEGILEGESPLRVGRVGQKNVR